MFFQVIRFQLKVGNRDAALNAYGAMLDSYGEGETPDPLPAREWMMLCDYLKELKMPAEAAGEYEKLATFLSRSAVHGQGLDLRRRITTTD